jgi:hypothetical protein
LAKRTARKTARLICGGLALWGRDPVDDRKLSGGITSAGKPQAC